MERFLKPSQVVQVLGGMDTRTLRTWLRLGVIPHIRIRGRLWIKESDLKRIIERHTIDPETRRRARRA